MSLPASPVTLRPTALWPINTQAASALHGLKPNIEIIYLHCKYPTFTPTNDAQVEQEVIKKDSAGLDICASVLDILGLFDSAGQLFPLFMHFAFPLSPQAPEHFINLQAIKLNRCQ